MASQPSPQLKELLELRKESINVLHGSSGIPSYFLRMQLKRKKWNTFLALFLNTAIFCNMVTAFHDISVEEVEEELVDGGSFLKPFCWHTFCG